MSGTRDRRAHRRQQTIDEICDVALGLMAEEGVGGLNLAEIARRMGIRPPSLYQYFDSKLALYDALYATGSRRLRQSIDAATSAPGEADPLTMLRRGVTAMVRWCVENPVLSQLMLWRPVPGFEPSPESFALSVGQVEQVREVLLAGVHAGQLDPAAAADDGIALLTILVSGVISQHLANEPTASYDSGRFVKLAPAVIELFIENYAPGGNNAHNADGRGRLAANRSKPRA